MKYFNNFAANTTLKIIFFFNFIFSSSEYLALQHEVTSLIVALWGTIELHGNPKITDRERKKRLKTWIKDSFQIEILW